MISENPEILNPYSERHMGTYQRATSSLAHSMEKATGEKSHDSVPLINLCGQRVCEVFARHRIIYTVYLVKYPYRFVNCTMSNMPC